LRLTSDQDALIRRAAEVEGTDLTNFTVTATLAHARDVLADRRLFAIDDTADFDSGEPSLDAYSRTRALSNHLQGASRCFVTCRDRRVAGYYALAAASVQRRDAPGKVRRNMPDPVPVILLSWQSTRKIRGSVSASTHCATQ
jgi:uncharacterized protein (DUF1778 family)